MAKEILLIDDDALILKTLNRLLSKQGYNIEIIKDSTEALEKALSTDYDLIICDIRMPGLDGIELISQIKEGRNQADKTEIPVIFITGYASEDAPIDAIKLGVKDYILKPFDMDKLLESIKSVFGE